MDTLTIRAQIVVPNEPNLDLTLLAGCELRVIDVNDLVATGQVDARGRCDIELPIAAILDPARAAVHVMVRLKTHDVLRTARVFKATSPPSLANVEGEEWAAVIAPPGVINARIALSPDEAGRLEHLRENEHKAQLDAVRKRWKAAKTYALWISAGLFALDALIAYARGKWPLAPFSVTRTAQMLAKLVATDALKEGFVHRVVNAAGAGASVVLMLMIAAAVFDLAQRLLGNAVDDLLKKLRDLFSPGAEKGASDGLTKAAAGLTAAKAMTAVVVVAGGVVAGGAITNITNPAADTSKLAAQIDRVDRDVAQIDKNLTATTARLDTVRETAVTTSEKLVPVTTSITKLETKVPDVDDHVIALRTQVADLRNAVMSVDERMITDGDLRTAIDGVRKVSVQASPVTVTPQIHVPVPSVTVEPKITVTADSTPVVRKLDEVKDSIDGVHEDTTKLVRLATTDLDADQRTADGVTSMDRQLQANATIASIDSARSVALGPLAGRRTLWQRVGDVFTGPRERFTISEAVVRLAPPGPVRECAVDAQRFTGRESFVSALERCWPDLGEDVRLKMVIAGRISY